MREGFPDTNEHASRPGVCTFLGTVSVESEVAFEGLNELTLELGIVEEIQQAKAIHLENNPQANDVVDKPKIITKNNRPLVKESSVKLSPAPEKNIRHEKSIEIKNNPVLKPEIAEDKKLRESIQFAEQFKEPKREKIISNTETRNIVEESFISQPEGAPALNTKAEKVVETATYIEAVNVVAQTPQGSPSERVYEVKPLPIVEAVEDVKTFEFIENNVLFASEIIELPIAPQEFQLEESPATELDIFASMEDDLYSLEQDTDLSFTITEDVIEELEVEPIVSSTFEDTEVAVKIPFEMSAEMNVEVEIKEIVEQPVLLIMPEEVQLSFVQKFTEAEPQVKEEMAQLVIEIAEVAYSLHLIVMENPESAERVEVELKLVELYEELVTNLDIEIDEENKAIFIAQIITEKYKISLEERPPLSEHEGTHENKYFNLPTQIHDLSQRLSEELNWHRVGQLILQRVAA